MRPLPDRTCTESRPSLFAVLAVEQEPHGGDIFEIRGRRRLRGTLPEGALAEATEQPLSDAGVPSRSRWPVERHSVMQYYHHHGPIR